MPIPADCATLRFFVWWKNGAASADIDLSAVLFDAGFNYQTEVAYYNLEEFGGCHSGDIVERKVIWCDMALKHNPRWVNNAQGNLTSIGVTLQSLASLNKPTLYELLLLHARSRGTLTVFAEEADVVFSVESGTPFRQEEIASEYMI